MWYSVVASEGLRSVGEEALPSSKSVCSILPIAICGPGLSGAPASIMLPLAALVSPHRTWHDQVDVVIYAAKFMGLSETGGRGSVGAM